MALRNSKMRRGFPRRAHLYRRNKGTDTTMNKPKNVPTEIWNAADAKQQEFIAAHESLHDRYREWAETTYAFAQFVKLDVDHIRAIFPFKGEN